MRRNTEVAWTLVLVFCCGLVWAGCAEKTRPEQTVSGETAVFDEMTFNQATFN